MPPARIVRADASEPRADSPAGGEIAESPKGDEASLTLRPIGIIRTPFTDRLSTPRQPDATGAEGRIELYPGHDFEHALEDLEQWDRIWVIFWFHLNRGWRPKVLPPRSAERRGVLSTRSPHRPSPIGLSTLELLEVRPDERLLRVRGVDMIDGTPVLDIKPYVAYADAHPAAGAGWLDELSAKVDPEPGFRVAWGDTARAQTEWLARTHGIDLVSPVEKILALGPQPHPYRRIRQAGDGFRLAHKEWRIAFRLVERTIFVDSVASGYRPRELAGAAPVHREFCAQFGTA